MKKKFKEVSELGKMHFTLNKDQNIGTHLQKLSEEFGELAQSINKISGLKSLKKNENLKDVYANILEEAADCVQIIFIITDLAGYSYEDLKKEIGKKNKAYLKYLKKLKG